MSRKSMASSVSSDLSEAFAQPMSVNLSDSHNQLDSVKPDKKRVPERFGECKMSNGWIRCASRFSRGRHYFYNTLTGAKSWIYPVSQKITLSDYDKFMVPRLTSGSTSLEDESPLALSSSEQPLSRNLLEILRVLNRLYSTSIDVDEHQYNASEDDLLHSLFCSNVVKTCLGTCNTSFTDDNVESLINRICTTANINGIPQDKPEQAENNDNNGREVEVCDEEVERGGNKEWKENDKIDLKTAIPVDQSDESTSSSSSSTSTRNSSDTSSTTSISTSTSYSNNTNEVVAQFAYPVRPALPLPVEFPGPSKEFAVPRLKQISFDDLQKSPIKSKPVPKQRYRRKTLPPLKPKPPREPRGPEVIIREVGNIKTISYNHFVPPSPCSSRGIKRSNLSDSSYSTLSDAKRFVKTQTKGVFGNGFGQTFPIVLKSLQLSEASSSSSESSHE